MNKIVTNIPTHEETREVHHVTIDLDAKVLNFGSMMINCSETLLSELKKCLDIELPKVTSYVSHELSITTEISPIK